MEAHKPYLAVFLIQFIYSGMFLLSKAVFNEGMKSCVFIFYRQLIGTLVLVPLAFIFERKSAVPLSFTTFCKIFLCSFFGVTLSLNVNAIALVYTSATLNAAIVNCLPVSTFFFAALLRMEKITIRTKPGIAKVAGLVVCMGGVTTLAFYKGTQLRHSHHLLSGYHHSQDHITSGKTWILGSILMFFSIVTWGFWLVIQARFLKSYPSKLTFTSVQCLSSAIQSFGIAIALERDIQQWKLGWNTRLLAVFYCGAMVTGVAFYMQAWVIQKKGPVFPSMWNPLSLIITISGSMFLLGEAVSLGSVLGGTLLVLSLYCVLWAKSKEDGMVNQVSLPVQTQKECAEVKQSRGEQ